MNVSRRLVMHFPPPMIERPVLCHLSRDYDLVFNILKASITPGEQGLLILELTGEQGDQARAEQYLTSLGVRLQPLIQDITRDEDRCVHCGACTGVCPSQALLMERPSMMVAFSPDHCVACGECVRVCPVRAMQLRF